MKTKDEALKRLESYLKDVTSDTIRIEAWSDANNLRAFPEVYKETINITDLGVLTFNYGPTKSFITLDTNKCFFIEFMNHN